jgi:hypothetical protein
MGFVNAAMGPKMAELGKRFVALVTFIGPLGVLGLDMAVDVALLLEPPVAMWTLVRAPSHVECAKPRQFRLLLVARKCITGDGGENTYS